MKDLPEFTPFPKIARLERNIIITEKIDGTNSQVHITDDGHILAGSRSRWLSPGKGNDNFGFAGWVRDHAEELLALGPGSHYGEWWGNGIQRGYGLEEKRFSLFNVSRWGDDALRPACCHVVPVLREALSLNSNDIDIAILNLGMFGSSAAPGFMKPEGVVVYHSHSNTLFKWTFDGDGHKGGA